MFAIRANYRKTGSMSTSWLRVTGCSMLDPGFWMLDTWMLAAGYWILEPGYSMLAIQQSNHYGQLPEDDLLDLWDADKCKFYRQRF